MDILKELVVLADSLDKKGLNKEADYLDDIINKYAAKKKDKKEEKGKFPFLKKDEDKKDKKEEKGKFPFLKKDEDKKDKKKEEAKGSKKS